MNQKAKVRGPRQNLKKRNGPAGNSSATGPREIRAYEIRHGTRLRFHTSAAIAGNITWQNLLDTILMVTTSTTASDLFYAVKLRKVSVWTVPVIGQTSDITVIFDATDVGFVGDRQVHTDTSMGIRPAFVSCSPTRDSLASKWQLSSNKTAFYLDCAAGSVVDIDLSFRADALGASVPAQNAVVSGVVGTVAYRGLDGLASASTKFEPPGGVNFV